MSDSQYNDHYWTLHWSCHPAIWLVGCVYCRDAATTAGPVSQPKGCSGTVAKADYGSPVGRIYAVTLPRALTQFNWTTAYSETVAKADCPCLAPIPGACTVTGLASGAEPIAVALSKHR